MEQTKALSALEPYLALIRSASSPAPAAHLITLATSAPNTYVFSELLRTPNIQALSSSSEYSPYLTLLKIFCYGTYATYTSTAGLPTLSDAQLVKLRQLSLLTLAKNSADLSYENLTAALGLQTPRELEDLVISAVYAGLVTATLDPHNKLVVVSSVSPLRDLEPESIPAMINTLDEWSARCSSTLLDLEKQMAGIKAEALKRHKEEQEWAAEVERLVDGKIKEPQRSEESTGNIGGIMSGLGRRLGGGAASKRGVGMMGVGGRADADDMDVDENDEDAGERKGLRSGKKRGFGF
ncbi:Uncharacterized protein BP5553_08660 [Venustampulla echinocandica]|uniref:PCI domain-containing protein n=1 Tax=Venustampulla echinocandica TaxID=2656787 RepID=A0A370TEW6_9HELO|nr:Uncharacterized protein BP5553_08660 [Venustampulla echinocandica]RDL33221.1 Uncharacterized protein BP5553_08660 [Venustampulla echinocandica]